MSETSEIAGKLAGVELYSDIASDIVRSREKLLSPKKQEGFSNLRFGQKTALLLSTLAFLAVAGCNNIGLLQSNDSSVPTATAVSVSSVSEKQKYKDVLPVDVLSEKQLEDVHVKICNTKDVKLHLREAVLNEDPLFKWAKEPLIIQGTEVKKGINIILVDGPIVHPFYLSPEQRNIAGSYGADYIPMTSDQIEAERKKRISQVNERESNLAKDFRNLLDQGQMTRQDYDRQMASREEITKNLIPQISQYTEEDIITLSDSTGGLFFVDDQYDKKDKSKLTSININLLIAVGEDQSKYSGNMLKARAQVPNPAQSFPSPDDYVVNLNAKYPVSGSGLAATPGFVIRHESAHFLKNSDESATDLYALETIKKAHEAYSEGDDSLYYFVFETPRGNVVTKDLAKENSQDKIG